MKNLEGQEAPAFELDGSDGRKHALKDYAGRTVVLYFYPRDNTPGCTKEACGFRDLHCRLAKLDAVVLGVSKDSRASHDRFIRDFQLPFVLLSDPGAEVLRLYGAWGEKSIYGKTSVGAIRSTVIIGPDGIVRKHWQTVKDAATHPADVLEFLTEV